MKLILKDNFPKEKGVRIVDLDLGQIFIDSNGDYCMVIQPEKDCMGEELTAVAVSGPSIGALLAYDGDTLVTPVNAELNILGYV